MPNDTFGYSWKHWKAKTLISKAISSEPNDTFLESLPCLESPKRFCACVTGRQNLYWCIRSYCVHSSEPNDNFLDSLWCLDSQIRFCGWKKILLTALLSYVLSSEPNDTFLMSLACPERQKHNCTCVPEVKLKYF